jgi:hypothetical protein
MQIMAAAQRFNWETTAGLIAADSLADQGAQQDGPNQRDRGLEIHFPSTARTAAQVL